MSSPVVLVVVLSSDAQSPGTLSMVSTARAALAGATVVVQEAPAAPTDEQALKAGKSAKADAVVVVTWPDSGPHAHLHLRVFSEPKWADRDLSFGAADAPSERGRSVGLTIAAMVPIEGATTPAPPPPPPEKPTNDAPPPPPRPQPKDAPRAYLELDAAALGTFGFTGQGEATGAELAARLVLPELITFRIGGGARFGEIESIEGPLSTTRGVAGVVVHAGRFRALDFGIGIDAGFVHHSVSRFGASGARETKSRFIGVGDLVFDAAYWFDRVGVFGAAGVELALGETRVLVGTETVATIPRARGLAMLGVRLRL